MASEDLPYRLGAGALVLAAALLLGFLVVQPLTATAPSLGPLIEDDEEDEVAKTSKKKRKGKKKKKKRKKKKRGKAGKLVERGEAPEGAPNVLLLVWDTTRADRMSLYGHDRKTTPRLEEYGASSLVFERATSAATWTVPAHASIFTGLAPTTHAADSSHKFLGAHFVTMAEWLRMEGFATWAWSANPHVARQSNLLQGFEHIAHPWGKTWKKRSSAASNGKLIATDRSTVVSPAYDPKSNPFGWSMGKTGRGSSKDAGPVAAEALLEWLEEREGTDDAPWFAFINYMEAHIPRIPSLEARQAIAPDTIEAQLALDQTFTALLHYTFEMKEYTPEELAVVRDTYDASLWDLDKATGQLLDGLAERGELDDTIVILTADHGEHLGEHHKFGHKYSMLQPIVNVPLVIRWPEGVEAGRSTDAVTTQDILATVGELLTLEPPDTSGGNSLLGPDRSPAISEMNEAAPAARKKFMRRYPDKDFSKWEPTARAIVADDGTKLIRDDSGGRVLFQVDDDPGELTDLSGAKPKRVDALTAELDAFLEETPVGIPARRSGKMTEEEKEHLRLLGYFEDDDE